MPDYGYNWKLQETCAYSTRHLLVVLLDRLKRQAKKQDQSVEFVLNQALDVGLTVLERRGKK